MKLLLKYFFLWNLHDEGKCWITVAQAEEEASKISNISSNRGSIKEKNKTYVKAFGIEKLDPHKELCIRSNSNKSICFASLLT